MKLLLRAAEAVYTTFNRLRRSLYRRGILRARVLPRPVVSIGNIAAGGAGKTPAVIALARELSRRGARVAVLTRGYGRRDTSVRGVVTSDDAARFGDEPVLIKKSLRNIDVIVGASRFENAVEYLRHNDCDLFLLDDGFQHLQLARDLDIVIDVPDAAFHRERRSALAAADVVVPRRIEVRVPDSARARRALAFAGIAAPDQFFQALRAGGVTLVATLTFADHHRYDERDLRRIDEKAAASGAELILTTEKDAVKVTREDIVAVPADFVFDPSVIERVAALLKR